MDRIIVKGGAQVSGALEISGAKNACLALMPAALLTDEPLTLTNAPDLTDITTMVDLLRSFGCEVAALKNNSVIAISAGLINNYLAEYDIVRKMRASILVLGPLLARVGQATVSLPGGCAIGARPVDLHLKGLEAMGAELNLVDGYINANAKSGLQGANYEFPSVSVGATENLIMAATLAKGSSCFKNCAREPEVVDLCNCLKSMGAKISGAGTSEILIEGVSRLSGTTHKVISDRIELGTYMLVPAIAGGTLLLKGATKKTLEAFTLKLEETGAVIIENEEGLLVSGSQSGVEPTNIITEPYPGFPTDLQAQMMALLIFSNGVSLLEEKIFENRFMHAPELMRMGANIELDGGTAKVTGVKKIKGAPVMATDLRASVSLILAALAAEGETVISRVYHLDRGYERLENKLFSCGVDIRRV